MRMFCMILALALVAGTGMAQFKTQSEQPTAVPSIVRAAPDMGSLLGFINPENFSMHHSFSVGYLSGGGTGLSMASYTNSMFYKIADPLNVRMDLTLQGSPFGASTPYQSALNGVFLSRAELNYHPWQNFFISVQYNHRPGYGYYNGYYDPWYGPGGY